MAAPALSINPPNNVLRMLESSTPSEIPQKRSTPATRLRASQLRTTLLVESRWPRRYRAMKTTIPIKTISAATTISIRRTVVSSMAPTDTCECGDITFLAFRQLSPPGINPQLAMISVETLRGEGVLRTQPATALQGVGVAGPIYRCNAISSAH